MHVWEPLGVRKGQRTVAINVRELSNIAGRCKYLYVNAYTLQGDISSRHICIYIYVDAKHKAYICGTCILCKGVLHMPLYDVKKVNKRKQIVLLTPASLKISKDFCFQQLHDFLVHQEGDSRLRHDSQNIGDKTLVQATSTLTLHDEPKCGKPISVLHSPVVCLPLLQPCPHYLHIIRRTVSQQLTVQTVL